MEEPDTGRGSDSDSSPYLGLMFSALLQGWVAASEPTQHFPRRVDHGMVLEGQWGGEPSVGDWGTYPQTGKFFSISLFLVKPKQDLLSPLSWLTDNPREHPYSVDLPPAPNFYK